MASKFQELVAAVAARTFLNVDWFAQTVVYKTADGDQQSLPAHVRHEIRLQEDQVIEQIHVEMERAQLPLAPDFGDRILLADDEQAYLYSYSGKHQWSIWKATFERRRKTKQKV